MRFVIVTGMSGAGKTSVLKFLEDINFFCVDNIPPALLPKFAELCYEQEGEIERVAMGIDIRGGKLFNDLFEVLSDLQHKGYEYEILFLDASDDVLINAIRKPEEVILFPKTAPFRGNSEGARNTEGCQA